MIPGEALLQRCLEPSGHFKVCDPKISMWRWNPETPTVKQLREQDLNRGLWWERNHCGKKLSSKRSQSDYMGAGRNEKSWAGRIGNNVAYNNSWAYDDCYRRQSEQSCMFQNCLVWAWWEWWRYRARQAEWRWPTWLGGGHNVYISTPADAELYTDVDEAWRIDTAGVRVHSQLFLSKKFNIWDNRIEDASCW